MQAAQAGKKKATFSARSGSQFMIQPQLTG